MCRDPLEMEREGGRGGGEREKERPGGFIRIAKVVQVPLELVHMDSHTD